MLHESTLWGSCFFLHQANVLTRMSVHWARRMMMLHLHSSSYPSKNKLLNTGCQKTSEEIVIHLFLMCYLSGKLISVITEHVFHIGFFIFFVFKLLKVYKGQMIHRKSCEKVKCICFPVCRLLASCQHQLMNL